MFWGAHAWFTWWCDYNLMRKLLVCGIIAFISLLYQKRNKIILLSNSRIVCLFLLFVIAGQFKSHISVTALLRECLMFIPIWVLLSDSKQRILQHTKFVIRVLSIILTIGLVEFLVLNFIDIPGFPIVYGENTSNYVFLNYIFYINNIGEAAGLREVIRFDSIFLEPGYMSALLVFLLYAIKFKASNFEKGVIIISLFLSFSLAGYLMFIFAYFFINMVNNKRMWYIIPFVVSLFLCYKIAISYNGGNNLVNHMIIERLEYDSENIISGNNRVSKVTDRYFEEGMKNGDNILGLGVERVTILNRGSANTFEHTNIAGTGIVYYIVVYGFVSAFFFLLFYLCLGQFGRDKRYAFFFVLLVISCFIQSSYPDSFSWILPFSLGIKLT